MSTATKDRKLPIAVEDVLSRHENRLEAIYSAVSGLGSHPPAASGVMDIVVETKKLLRRELEGVGLTVRANGRGERAPDPPAPEDGPRPDPAAGLDHGLAWEAITTLALAEQLAMDFGHRFIGDRMLHELAEVRHRIEDHIGVDGKLSDGIVDHAGDRYDAIRQDAREEVES